MITLGPFDTLDQAVNGAINLLRTEGYVVTIAHEDFVPLKAYRERFVCPHPSHFNRLLSKEDCPDFRSLRGDTGRIVKIQPNPSLDAWLETRLKRRP